MNLLRVAPPLFILGGAGYVTLELIWRGRSHISMFFAGGLCFSLMVWLSGLALPFMGKCLLAGLCVTGVEFVTGCIVNLWLGLRVWDYSDRRFQIGGQICLLYLLAWCGLSAVVFGGIECIKWVVKG